MTSPDTTAVIAFDGSNLSILSLVGAYLLPLLVGLVTHERTSSRVKVGLLATLAVASAAVETFIRDCSMSCFGNWKVVVVNSLVNLVVALAAHGGIWKKIGATQAAQRTLVHPRKPSPRKR